MPSYNTDLETAILNAETPVKLIDNNLPVIEVRPWLIMD